MKTTLTIFPDNTAIAATEKTAKVYSFGSRQNLLAYVLQLIELGRDVKVEVIGRALT